MKKYILTLCIILASLFVNAQTDSTTYNNKWHFYVSPAISWSSQGSIGYGIETGIYNNNFWFALTNETYSTNPFIVVTGIRGYYNTCQYNKSAIYVNLAGKFIDNKNSGFILEPGICYVYQASKLIAFQYGISVPWLTSQNIKNTPFSTGIALNFDF